MRPRLRVLFGQVRAHRRLVRLNRDLRGVQVRVVTRSDSTVTSWPIEDYVVGVIAAETDEHWPDTAIMAQAVACRTYGLRRIVHPRSRDFEVTDSVTDQCFIRPALASERVRELVAQTAGEHLVEPHRTLGRRRPHTGAFHIACGGSTDDPGVIWGTETTDLVVARCTPCDRGAPRWNARISTSQLRRAAGWEAEGKVTHMQIMARTPGGRARLVGIDDGTDRVTITAERLRRSVGYTDLPSTRFWTTEEPPDPSGITVEGIGHGHGVGLCMLGTQALARQGADHHSILAHYYPDARMLPVP